MVMFLIDPVNYRTWTRTMPNLGLTREDAQATVAYGETWFYRDGCDWTSGKIAMRSPRTEPSQSSLAT
jgi:hypothetical protein